MSTPVSTGAPALARESGPGSAPAIREASFADYLGITRLQGRNGLQTQPYDDWAALWKSNPAFKDRRDHWPIGWVLETGEGKIVGTIFNLPLAYRFRGRDLLATSPNSWAVDAGYRAHSLALVERVIKQKGIDLVVCTTVGASSEPVWRLFESRVPAGTWNESRFWITGYRGFINSVFRKKSMPSLSLAAYPLSAVLYCWDRIAAAHMPLRNHNLRIEVCSGFDSRFDEFWAELERQKRETLLAVRTRETLAWHFGPGLLRGNTWVMTAAEGGRLVAYAVFDKQDRPDLGLERVRLVDCQALSGFERAPSAILRSMLRTCRKKGIHLLENTGCWLEERNLPRVPRSHRRSLSCWFYYYKAIDRDLARELKNPATWSPSAYDGDASL